MNRLSRDIDNIEHAKHRSQTNKTRKTYTTQKTKNVEQYGSHQETGVELGCLRRVSNYYKHIYLIITQCCVGLLSECTIKSTNNI